MNTPIYDYVKKYKNSDMSRLHMPGHKGHNVLGMEAFDITEVSGADSLYHADGIIMESEKNATHLFGSRATLYSTEGSTHCIKSMVALAAYGCTKGKKPLIFALRNVHKAFVNACALVDISVKWIFPDEDNDSICSCNVSIDKIEKIIKETIEVCTNDGQIQPVALYMTSPDYLGNIYDVKAVARICDKYNIMHLVDNAHGAYLKFLKEPMHPIELGAHMCSDSAHKTLPVLTGGAYLQISKKAPAYVSERAKDVMALFGSTSPSYLIMESMDLCNKYMEEKFSKDLEKTVENTLKVKGHIKRCGFVIKGDEPIKITVHTSLSGFSGFLIADELRNNNVECEYCDKDFVVLMTSPFNEEKDYERICNTFSRLKEKVQPLFKKNKPYNMCGNYNIENSTKSNIVKNDIADKIFEKNSMVKCPKIATTIREAVFAPQEKIPVSAAKGRVCGMSVVSCPPAIPIIVSGEIVNDEMIKWLEYNEIEQINVLTL